MNNSKSNNEHNVKAFIEGFDPTKSDIYSMSEIIQDHDIRFKELIEVGNTLYKVDINNSRVSIKEYTVINSKNITNDKLLIVLSDGNTSQVVKWKDVKYNDSVGCYYSRKEDALYIAYKYIHDMISQLHVWI